MFRRAVVWSLCEVEYLSKHLDKDINQLTIYLSKSRHAVQKKIREIKNPELVKKNKLVKKRTHIGKRKDLNGICTRSSWEANFLRYLKKKKLKWEYEPKVFHFTKVNKGSITSYCPDVKVYLNKKDYIWVEVKGRLYPGDQTRIKRFKQYYPEEFAKLHCIPGSKSTKSAKYFEKINVPVYCYYNDLNKEFKNEIKHWE